MVLNTTINILARNPPSIVLAGGLIALAFGSLLNITEMLRAWPWLIAIGVILQFAWLYFNQ